MAHVVVTGGAGFLGSHLADALLARGDRVTAVDNLLTGRVANVAHLENDRRFSLVVHDVCDGIPVEGAVDAVLHFASPASPQGYMTHPLETLRVGSRGTEHALDLAETNGARFLLASTSEVYGDPEMSPQSESYWGHVNPIGPRSVYDEAKRYAEALTMAYHRARRVDTRIVRIFNTYGPRMAIDDGRVLPAFVAAADDGRPLKVHGDGLQTRSFSFVTDTVAGVLCVLDKGDADPVNVGTPGEITILGFAKLVLEIAECDVPIEHVSPMTDDPKRREPDVTRITALGWAPKVALRDGLERTIAWYRTREAQQA